MSDSINTTVVAPSVAQPAVADAAVAAAAKKSQESSSTRVKVSHINVSCEKTHLAIIQLLGCVLNQLVSFEEQQYPQGRGGISMFHTAYVPSISIGSYLKRVSLYTKVSTEVLVQSVLHVHQLMQRTVNPLVVNKLNVHRLLLTSLMCTAKYFDDAHYNNAYYSYVGGVPLKELNALEVEFLSLLNFDFYVNPQTYQYFYSMVVEKNIHLNGCTCASQLPNLPKSMPVNEYTPSPEPDFSDCPSLDSVSDDDSCSAMDCRSPTSSISSLASTVSEATTATPPVQVLVPASVDDMNEELGSIKIEDNQMATTPEAPYRAQTAANAVKTPKQKVQVQIHQYHRPAPAAGFAPSPISRSSIMSSVSRLTDSPVSSIGSVSSISRGSVSSYVSSRHMHRHSPSLSSVSHQRYASEQVIPSEMNTKSTPRQVHMSVTPRQSDLARKEQQMQQQQAPQRIVM